LRVEGLEASGMACIVFRTASGEEASRDCFPVTSAAGGQGVALRSYQLQSIPSPILVAVGHQVGADGVNTEVALYSVDGGKVKGLWVAPRSFRYSQEGLCFGSLGGKHGPGFTELRVIEGDEGVLGAHAYRAVQTRLSHGRLDEVRILTTRSKHIEATEAANELGLDCTELISETVLKDDESVPPN